MGSNPEFTAHAQHRHKRTVTGTAHYHGADSKPETRVGLGTWCLKEG